MIQPLSKFSTEIHPSDTDTRSIRDKFKGLIASQAGKEATPVENGGDL